MRLTHSPHPPSFGRKAAGFSLIEVNMAILVVAGGLLALFALFPAGLRMSASALADTRQSLFASDVLSSMQARASTLTISEWMDPEKFWDKVSEGTPLADAVVAPADVLAEIGGAPTNSLLNQVYLYSGEEKDYFSNVKAKSDNARLNPVPARYAVRINRQSPAVARLLGGRDQHLDFLTWRISLVISDQSGGWFYQNPVYHIELRFPGKP